MLISYSIFINTLFNHLVYTQRQIHKVVHYNIIHSNSFLKDTIPTHNTYNSRLVSDLLTEIGVQTTMCKYMYILSKAKHILSTINKNTKCPSAYCDIYILHIIPHCILISLKFKTEYCIQK